MSNTFNLVFHKCGSLVSYAALGYLMGLLFQATNLKMFAFVALFALIGLIIPNSTIPATALAFIASISILGALSFLPGFGGVLFDLHPVIVPLLVFMIFVLVAPRINEIFINSSKSNKPLNTLTLNFASLLYVAPFAFFYSRGGDRFALNLVVNSGEDNAAWLENISSGTLGTVQASFTSQYSDGSGEPFGIFLNLVHNVFIFVKDSASVVTDSPRILITSYGLILIMGLLASLGTLLFVLSLQHENIFFALMFSIPLFMSIYFGWASFAHLGHLPAAFSFFIIISALAFSFLPLNHSRLRVFSLITTAVMLLSAGVTWLPLLPVALVSITVFITVVLYKYSKSNSIQSKKSRLTLLSSGALIILMLVKSMHGLASGLELSYFRFLIHAQGATVDPFGWPIILAMIGFVWLSNHLTSHRQMVSDLISIFVIVFSSYTILITFLSLVTDPFQLDYAAKKLALLLTFVGLVFLVYAFAVVISSMSLEMPTVFVALSALVVAVVFLSPGPKLSYPITQVNSSVPWVTSGLYQLKKHPERPLVCLNTSRGVSAASFDVYFCNRILGALQASKNVEVRAWAMRSLQEDWLQIPSNTYQQFSEYGITFLVTDISRTSTDNESQRQFLNEIPKAVRNFLSMND